LQNKLKILITGVAGFIGFHLAQRLLARGDTVIGVDNLNDYYDVTLKEARLQQLQTHAQSALFNFIKLDITDVDALNDVFQSFAPQRVVHLAAQAGVRYSLQNPLAYAQSNLLGFTNILEVCRHHAIEHLVYASSSSVYGGNTKTPFSETDMVDGPVSFYAATKKANELMAHTYSHLYDLPTTGLRFFTVYGPWGRPDMSPFLFAHAIYNNQPIKVFNHGDMMRDFTYIDDIIEGVVRVIDKIATPAFGNTPPYRIFNIGNHQPEQLLDFIQYLEQAIGKKAIKEFLPMQNGDVKVTYADTSALNAWVGFEPSTDLKTGLDRFVDWYEAYFGYQASSA
jgi:UDP-glucuronate 4-epimerase